VKVSLVLATPADPREAEELTTLVSAMWSEYGKGKWCPDAAKPDRCLNIARKAFLIHYLEQLALQVASS
jgi:hypothetical protein